MSNRVDAYRNLNDDCISLRSREPETRGTVVDHVQRAIINETEFVVQPAGRQRVLDQERKNAHAFVRGVLTDADPCGSEPVAIMYDPYEYDSFVTVTDERPVCAADSAVVTTAGVHGYGVTYSD
jgi:hypothetical protein